MIIMERSARALLKAMGFENADSYSLKVCGMKLAKAATLPESTRGGVKDAALRRLLGALIASRDGVEVRPDSQPLERSAIAISRRKTLSDERECFQTDDQAAPTGTTNVKRKKGVQYHIFQKLLAGSQKKPVHRDELVDHLCQVFPGRSIASMSSSIQTFPTWIPTRYPGYEVVRVEKDLYFVRKADETKP